MGVGGKKWTASHYEVLGLSSTASQEDVKKAYVQLSKQFHPDKPTGDVEKSKQINVAYTILSRSESRKEYDAELERNTWRPAPVDDPHAPRPATYDEVHKMYGFPNQSGYQNAGRFSKSLLTAFFCFATFGIITSFWIRYRDRVRPVTEAGQGSIESSNYLGGNIVARRAAASHRRIRERTRAHGGFDEQLRYVESTILGKTPVSPPQDSTAKSDAAPSQK